MQQAYETALPVSSSFCLTVPTHGVALGLLVGLCGVKALPPA